MTVKGDTLIIFSYFKFGQLPSVCIYSTALKREILQLLGANQFLHSYRENDMAQTEYLIVLADPIFSETIINNKE